MVEAAIRRATRPWVDHPGSGHRVVIEPAGNGNTHLGDTALFQDRFVSMGKDTSAVMVGNGTILEPLAKASGSNYGIRVDVNAGASFSNGSQKRSGPIRVDASVQEAHLPPSVHAEGQLRIDVETREESPIR